jgi:hypothetical protein
MSDKGGGIGSTSYLIARPEKRGAQRKITGQDLPAVIDHRPSPRKIPPYEMHGQVLGEIEAQCTVLDVSLSGIRIRSKVSLVPGREIGLYFLVPLPQGNRQVPINPSFKVIWIKPDQDQITTNFTAGLQLLDTTMTALQQEAYKQFVNNLPDSSTAHSK